MLKSVFIENKKLNFPLDESSDAYNHKVSERSWYKKKLYIRNTSPGMVVAESYNIVFPSNSPTTK